MADRKNATLQVYDPAVGPARGILRPFSSQGTHTHARLAPAPELLPWIQHYWIVGWHLPDGITQTVNTIPHPNIHLVFSRDGALIHGIHPRVFTKTLSGSDSVFGIKFRAGGFRPFYRCEVATLRARTIPADSVFGPEIHHMLAGKTANEERIAAANHFFTQLLNTLYPPDPEATRAAKLCEESPSIRTVAQLASITGSTERSLQRLFRDHIGATPKWVIRRYRIHELVERLNALGPGDDIDWAATALDLGYFDQSHMIRDFRSLTGYRPDLYRRRATHANR